ncbi:phage terminase small subunit P27 family [Leuconostoc suionicum]|uniref:phage terminase small subunit P27 family n=1 Tax=Leuconostoc suionicum TaxID=1511761 RepID=UPI0024ACA12D|nr:phage terminase small subunit P27 family [Leuconostoc suionicum]MDI6550081.1 phage terminase small subunit P27 family [Leuconostoc suionicum]
MPRKAKITTDDTDRAYQRERTEALKEANADIKQLPKTAPKHLTGVASRLWTTLVPALNKLGYITVADKSTLEAFCINYSVMREAYENIKDVGAIYENSGRYYKNPATAVLNDATGKVKSLGGELGLSPSSRATLIDMASDDDGSLNADAIADMFGGSQ